MKREQILTYYPLMSLEDIDWKIKEVGKTWKRIEDISISYFGGAYMVRMLAKELTDEYIKHVREIADEVILTGTF